MRGIVYHGVKPATKREYIDMQSIKSKKIISLLRNRHLFKLIIKTRFSR
jgi:hypothetical protein